MINHLRAASLLASLSELILPAQEGFESTLPRDETRMEPTHSTGLVGST